MNFACGPGYRGYFSNDDDVCDNGHWRSAGLTLQGFRISSGDRYKLGRKLRYRYSEGQWHLAHSFFNFHHNSRAPDRISRRRRYPLCGREDACPPGSGWNSPVATKALSSSRQIFHSRFAKPESWRVSTVRPCRFSATHAFS